MGTLISRASCSGRPLNTVAQAYRLNFGCAVDGPTFHGHRVNILQKCDVWTEFFHILAHLDKHRYGAQTAHDAADAQCIGNRLAQPILLGYFKIDHCARFVAAHLNHRNGIVGAVQRRAQVCGGLNDRLHTQGLRDLVSDH